MIYESGHLRPSPMVFPMFTPCFSYVFSSLGAFFGGVSTGPKPPKELLGSLGLGVGLQVFGLRLLGGRLPLRRVLLLGAANALW